VHSGLGSIIIFSKHYSLFVFVECIQCKKLTPSSYYIIYKKGAGASFGRGSSISYSLWYNIILVQYGGVIQYGSSSILHHPLDFFSVQYGRKSQDDAGFGPFIIVATVIILHPHNSVVLKDAHDGLKEISDGFWIFGTAFLIHDLPFVGHLVCHVLVQEVVGRVRVGPIDLVGVSLAVLTTAVSVSVMVTGTGQG